MYGLCVIRNRIVSSCKCYSTNSSKRLLDMLAKMPKANSARIAEAQQKRQNISKKSEKYGPSTVYIQVLGSGAVGAPSTLYLFTDQNRYLFNCGECTQRLAHEHKVKLSKLDHIFITTKTWKNIGGLPGLSLTLQDVGVPNITLHGPEGLDQLYNATKRFVRMNDMNVTMATCTPAVDFEDNVMSVRYILMSPDDLLNETLLHLPPKQPRTEFEKSSEYQAFIHDNTDYYSKPDPQNMPKEPKSHNVGKLSKSTPQQNNPSLDNKKKKDTRNVVGKTSDYTAVAYVCTLKKRLGTLDLAKCVELGVPPGPLLGQLKQGIDVVLPDGKLVKSSSVKTPDDPGPIFIVLDVPDTSLLRSSEFSMYFNDESNPPENIPALIVHFTPPHVFQDEKYIEFISKFGPCTRHLVLNGNNACLGSEAVHRTQNKLHLLDSEIFPLLRDRSIPTVWNPPDRISTPRSGNIVKMQALEQLKNKFQNIVTLDKSRKTDGLLTLPDGSNLNLETIPAHTLTMFHLRPKIRLDRTAEPKLNIQEYIQEAMDADGFLNSLEHFRRLVDSIKSTRNEMNEYPSVVFLGTGSCIPSKTRNTSAIMLHIDENRSILMDCGEGTFGQMIRFYGYKKINTILRNIKAIYVSHLHADHHIGLIGVLQARWQAFKEANETYVPVYLFAPGQIMSWLMLYDQHFEPIMNHFTIIPNQNLLTGKPEAAVLAAIGAENIQMCLVVHCPNAFGVSIEMEGNFKVTYSGDTRPCKELIEIGMNSTLLIHEATMEDELVEEARSKMHSTTTQAIDIGRQMNAEFTILTHFSQRYARLPRLNTNILNDNSSVGIAFDNMQISLADLPVLPYMYPPLQLMFAEHCVEMEMKAAQRQRRLQQSTDSCLQELPSKIVSRLPPNNQQVKMPGNQHSGTNTPKRSFVQPSEGTHAAKRSRNNSGSQDPSTSSTSSISNSMTPDTVENGESRPESTGDDSVGDSVEASRS